MLKASESTKKKCFTTKVKLVKVKRGGRTLLIFAFKTTLLSLLSRVKKGKMKNINITSKWGENGINSDDEENMMMANGQTFCRAHYIFNYFFKK